jgi:very-short-patch-repair endonuclease
MRKPIYAKFCICQICGKKFWVRGKRALTAKYCSKECANIGQPLNRTIWNKGLTKDTDEKMRRLAEASKRNNKMRGIKPENHPMYGKHHTEESKKKISEHYNGWKNTQKQIDALDKGRSYFKGMTKENCPAVKRRADILSKMYKNKKKPEHSERMKKFYKEYPELHPNYICAQKGHITNIEKIIKEELKRRNISFIYQYPLDGFFLDFAIIKDDIKLDIECDGEYWHKDKEKDNIRNCKIKDIGWEVIRFKGKDIINYPEICVDKIEIVLKGVRLSA